MNTNNNPKERHMTTANHTTAITEDNMNCNHDTTTTPGEREARQQHLANIGRIVMHLAGHEVGDYGDCSINNPIVNIIDEMGHAHEIVSALAEISEESAEAIVRQLGPAGGSDGRVSPEEWAEWEARYDEEKRKRAEAGLPPVRAPWAVHVNTAG